MGSLAPERPWAVGLGRLKTWAWAAQGTQDRMAPIPLGEAACLGDEWCGDVVHDIWLHSIGMWPAAQCQAASAAALVPICQTPIVAVDVRGETVGGDKEESEPLEDLEETASSEQTLP